MFTLVKIGMFAFVILLHIAFRKLVLYAHEKQKTSPKEGRRILIEGVLVILIILLSILNFLKYYYGG